MKKLIGLFLTGLLSYCNLQLAAREAEDAFLGRDDIGKTVKCNDPILEMGLTHLLHKDISNHDYWSKAMVYVVETKTGKMLADISYMREGYELLPCSDNYDQEQATILYGPTYLALLSSGKVQPETVFDTGNGIYGEVRDHNWRRGSYGKINLEKAFCVQSAVAFTKAKEYVFGNDLAELNETISHYVGNNQNQAKGILTFYNAIANGGRMVKLISEGEEVVILNEQIARPDCIKTFQNGMEKAVSDGIFVKAADCDTNVSAYGRIVTTEGSHRRLELCGYYPSENPHYTVMVILEKDGLPASVGGMCGHIFAQTIRLLMELYHPKF